MFLTVVGFVFVFTGVLLLLLGVAGFIRLSDIYMKIGFCTKSLTLGVIALNVGLVFLKPDFALLLAVITVFLIIAIPFSDYSIIQLVKHIEAEDTDLKPKTRYSRRRNK